MLRYSLILLAVAGLTFLLPVSPASAQANCRTVVDTVVDGGVQHSEQRTICRGADGVWRPQQTAPVAGQAAVDGRGGARPSQAEANDWAFAFGEHIRCGALLSVAGLYGNTDRYQNLATTSLSRAMVLAGEAGLSRSEASELVRTVGLQFTDKYVQEPPTPAQIAECERLLR